jgi:hypothetical protein
MEAMRTVHLRPYLKGAGPTFTLRLYETGKRHPRGTSYVGYKLTMRDGRKRSTVFEGEDYSPSPMDCVDDDETVKGILGFLTLRPGDTDREYFDRYTDAQREFAEQHAESLASEVMYRFGE